MPEPDQIVIPRSWAEFRERLIRWYGSGNGSQVTCAFYILALIGVIILLVCTSFPESRVARVIALGIVCLGFLIFTIVALTNALFKGVDLGGREIDGCIRFLWIAQYLLFGLGGFILFFWFLIRKLIEWYG